VNVLWRDTLCAVGTSHLPTGSGCEVKEEGKGKGRSRGEGRRRKEK
jgi:hypothetical protein